MQNFGDFDMWLAAENGMFLRSAKGRWMTTMPEHLNMDWVDSVKVNLLNYLFSKLKLLKRRYVYLFKYILQHVPARARRIYFYYQTFDVFNFTNGFHESPHLIA